MAEDTNLTSIVSEVSDIMGWDRTQLQQEVEAEAAHPGSHVRTAWLDVSPNQPAEVESFYSTTDAYILDLMVESGRDVRQRWRQAVVETLEHWWGGAAGAAVLDYGGGVGTDTLWFADHCRSAAYYDVPGRTSDFAMKRFARRAAGVTRVLDPAAYSLHFDAVVSFEVLEHLVDPQAHLDTMVRLTKTGGLLFLTESFDLVTDDYPSHIPANRALAGQLDELLAGRGCHPVALLEDRIHVYAKGPAVTTIVPIYNAYNHVSRLLESIRTTSPGFPVSWLLVNDASPDPRISELLTTFAHSFDGACRVIDRKENVGFPLTCNEAMEAAGTDDVILLNSDTILYDGWTRKLLQAAYADPRIATATPLSNSASCYSVFQRISPQNQLSSTLDDANRPPIDIPVGVGFCLFIKREVLDRVGYFDSIFGKGYGEETDLCLRAAQVGYRHVLVPNAFVYHAGSASMLEANVIRKGESTVQDHERTVATRYPTFEPAVHQFIASGTMERLSWELANRYVTRESGRRPSIAVVVHDDIFAQVVGGTSYHIRDMMRELENEYAFYVITPATTGIGVRVTAYVDGIGETITPYASSYREVLDELNPSLIHIHHLMRFSDEFITTLIAWNGPKYFTIHDYYGVCPQYTLLNFKQEFCHVPGPAECDQCAKALFGTSYAAIAERRAVYQKLVDSCTQVLAPSATALEVFRKAITIPDCKTKVIPHPIVVQKYRGAIRDPFASTTVPTSIVDVAVQEFAEDGSTAAKKPSAVAGSDECDSVAAGAPERSVQCTRSMVAQRKAHEARLRVGFIGYNSPHKGTVLLQALVTACSCDPILFVAIGDIGKTTSDLPNVIATGLYERQDVVDLIQAHKIDIMIVASLWPETFCYTVSEAWMAGVPVLTGPLGAQAERVRETGAGIALPDFNVKTFASALRDLAENHAQLDDLKRAAMLVTPPVEYGAYREEYAVASGGQHRMTRLYTSVRRDPPMSVSAPMSIPIVETLVRIRKRVFPVGSTREHLYFWLHNRISQSYAGRA